MGFFLDLLRDEDSLTSEQRTILISQWNSLTLAAPHFPTSNVTENVIEDIIVAADSSDNAWGFVVMSQDGKVIDHPLLKNTRYG